MVETKKRGRPIGTGKVKYLEQQMTEWHRRAMAAEGRLAQAHADYRRFELDVLRQQSSHKEALEKFKRGTEVLETAFIQTVRAMVLNATK
jgi:hypothetical protein